MDPVDGIFAWHWYLRNRFQRPRTVLHRRPLVVRTRRRIGADDEEVVVRRQALVTRLGGQDGDVACLQREDPSLPPSEPEGTFAARNSKQLMDPGMIVNVIVDAVAPSVRAVWRTNSRDISTSGPVGLPVIEKLDPRPKRSILADVRMCFKMPVITVKRAIRRPDPSVALGARRRSLASRAFRTELAQTPLVDRSTLTDQQAKRRRRPRRRSAQGAPQHQNRRCEHVASATCNLWIKRRRRL